jgi:hypothetical protein
MTRDDLRQMLRDLPVALLVLVALWLFCGLTLALLGPP